MTVEEIVKELKELQRYDVSVNFFGDDIAIDPDNDEDWVFQPHLEKLIKRIEATQ